MRLEDLRKGQALKGVLPDQVVTVVDVTFTGPNAVELTYKTSTGKVDSQIILRARQTHFTSVESGPSWTFDADADLFKLVTEAHRIRMGYLFDPHLAVTTSLVDPLPHQIAAVYGEMLQRHPLRFLLADDPGAGKTIMTGLFIKELIARGDLKRCLVVCPGGLAEQWQDELHQKFHLNFKIISRETIANAVDGNPFREINLAIGRLDLISRNDDVRAKLSAAPEWDLVVCDEAHKMSASVFGQEIKRTMRYQLGQLLSERTRHLLMLTATPHNGKDADFQLFMALLDPDRFAGRYRPEVHANDTGDLMRRMVKENLVRFDGTPLFPERRAYTVRYTLSELERQLYDAVTAYVRDEFNRAERLQEGRRGTVGFALTSLQRRLASSPEAIYQSLRRRRERLERRLTAERMGGRPSAELGWDPALREVSAEDVEDIEDLPDAELERFEDTVVDQATAARTIAELEAEIRTLRSLETLAEGVRVSRTDRKWEQLSGILQDHPEMKDASGRRRKLVLFTEHVDTLRYLEQRIATQLGRPEEIVVIHGSLSRDARRKAQLLFTQDKQVNVLLATDAAGEGINLQRAHLMVNYDLPWNPNRLEQRFGRIHRIGQTEVCHLWNLVAADTREGEVFDLLLTKLERAREALGGRDAVYDVLGRVFRGTELRDLLIEAIRYGERPDVKAKLHQQLEMPLDTEHIRDLLEEHALAHDSMDASKLQRIREEMERAEAQKLQPHYISSFFRAAFQHLGGTIHEREAGRWEITHVPTPIRVREAGVGGPILQRYERITFEKDRITAENGSVAEYVCPGHPLLEATIDVLLERNADVLSRGTILVDNSDPGHRLRLLILYEHTIGRAVGDRVLSRRMQFVQVDEAGDLQLAGPAPHLNCDRAPEHVRQEIGAHLQWVDSGAAVRLKDFAVQQLVPDHIREVTDRQQRLVKKAMAAVQDRLTKEIAYWDRRAEELKAQAAAGKQPKMNPQKARERADELRDRMQARMEELKQDLSIVPRPPVSLGAALVVPAGFVRRLAGGERADPDQLRKEEVERLAMGAVKAAEQRLGFEPEDVSTRKIGYDVESRDPKGGRLRFIEVKGRAADADSVTVTRNEVTVGLNSPERFILAIALVEGDEVSALHYVRNPFGREPDFGVTSLNYDLAELLKRAEPPR